MSSAFQNQACCAMQKYHEKVTILAFAWFDCLSRGYVSSLTMCSVRT